MLDSQRSSTQRAIYVQDEITLARWLIVNAGLRYDAYQLFTRVTPRAALIVMPTSTQSFKYLYGNAFRAPNAYELNTYYFGAQVEQLRPESIDTHEFVWERYVNGWLRTSVSTYWYKADQLIATVPDASTFLGSTYVNLGQVRAKGLEVEAQMRLMGGARTVMSYALQSAVDQETHAGLPNSPRHMAQARLSLARAVASVLGVGGRTISELPTNAGRRDGIGRDDLQRHHDPAARARVGGLRRRAKHVRQPVCRPRLPRARAGQHCAERPNRPDRPALAAGDEIPDAAIRTKPKRRSGTGETAGGLGVAAGPIVLCFHLAKTTLRPAKAMTLPIGRFHTILPPAR